jgi:hypothetical protein
MSVFPRQISNRTVIALVLIDSVVASDTYDSTPEVINVQNVVHVGKE